MAIEWFDSAAKDARYGLRQLRKTPALATAVVLSLAIGVGANTAIFSLVDAAILKPLPVKDPDSLRILEWTADAFPEGVHNINGDFSRIAGNRFQASSIGANLYRALARQQTAFDSIVGVADPTPVAVSSETAPAEQINLQHVSANFFQALGVLPAVGRPFRDDEDRVGQEPVVVVSHRYWTTRLGGRPDALNRSLRINSVPARIIGVAPAGFFGLRAGQWNDLYAPLAARTAFTPSGSDGAAHGEDDRDWWVRPVGRLKPGVPEAMAQAQTAVFRKIAAASLDTEPRKIPELIALPGRRGFNALNPRDASALWILMLLVAVLLLIVCANLANLLLARSVGRQRESAIRLALGAARSRLFQQHAVESGILAVFGACGGLALGYTLARAIHWLFETGRDPGSAFDLSLDARVLAFTAALSVLTAFLFGAAPAIRAARADLNDALKSQARSVMGGRLCLPRLLVSLQIALCLTALFAAGLLGHSLRNLTWTDIGFDRENLAYASVNPWHAGYSAERVASYVDRLRGALANIPGVLQVGAVQVRPLSGNGNVSRVFIPGRPSQYERGVVKESERVNRNRAGEGLFEAVKIPLLAGRTIDRRDIHPGAQAVVVDELFARRFFPNRNPLGLRFGLTEKEPQRYEIVGVVRNSLYNSLRSDPFPTVYEPYVPSELNGSAVHFAIRAGIDSGQLAKAVRKAVASLDPATPLNEFHTQTGLIDRLLRTERLLGFVSAAFSVIALLLAAVGLGGLLAYAVARRTNEIGVRMALGAAAGDVVRAVLRDSLGMVAAGILAGLPCAYAVANLLKTALFHTQSLDPGTAVYSFGTLFAVALLASWVPARRAAKIDPMVALREE